MPTINNIRIDSHAHVFTRDLPLAPTRRHTLTYDALPQKYTDLLDLHGITYGVLTAPSFLGTDNSYLLRVLKQSKGRVRGTVIVEPGIGRSTLQEMDDAGVVGIRFNLYRVDAIPDLGSSSYRKLFKRVRDLDWHVEIYAEGPKLEKLVPQVTASGVKLVIDHFGSPDPGAGVNCAGFKTVLNALAAGSTWVKLSAPYRLGSVDAKTYAAMLLHAGGCERLVWGSDWPWVQHDDGKTYQMTLDWLDSWVPNERKRSVILGETPYKLFRFQGTRANRIAET